MSSIQPCGDTRDCVDLFRPQGLFLKPIARLNISVQLPQLKKSGAKISNWEVMEKVKEMARPFTFPVFKVNKSSLDFVRFEAEIENYSSMENVIAKLDMRTIKLSGFTELLKVRAAEAKMPFPTRADWDGFFKDNKEMDQMKAGERPDTIHLENIPCKWFVQYQDKSGAAPDNDKPSELILKKAFNTFGNVRLVDIPILDPYRRKMREGVSGITTFSFGQDLIFDAFVQFKEYIGFVKCMNALKGMKLCYKDRDTSKSWTANIRVDFDKTKHLSESMIKKRKQERERIIREEAAKEEEAKRQAKLEQMKQSEQMKVLEKEEKEQEEKHAAKKLVAEQRRLAREEKRKQKRLKKMNLTEEEEIAYRIGAEERKLLLAQRKLESIRILSELLGRIKGATNAREDLKNLEHREKAKKDEELKTREEEYKKKLVLKLKNKAKADIESQKSKINRTKNDGFKSDDDTTSSKGSSPEYRKPKTNRDSDDDLSDIRSEDEEDLQSEIDSEEEELRLTSTEEDSSSEEEQKKKKKKAKKEKKKDKKKERKREKRSESRSDRKRRELDKQIKMAEKISRKKSPKRSPRRERDDKADLWEYEKYDRDRNERERTPTGYYGIKDYMDRRRRSSSRESQGRHMSEKERDLHERRKFMDAAKMKRVNRFLQQQGMRKEQVEKEMERAYQQYFSSLARKEGTTKKATVYDNSKEEEWERLMNPHNYGGDNRSYRKPVLAQHYEDHQKEQLQNEIRIRERREREAALMRESRGGTSRPYDRERRRSRSRSRGRDRRERRRR